MVYTETFPSLFPVRALENQPLDSEDSSGNNIDVQSTIKVYRRRPRNDDVIVAADERFATQTPCPVFTKF